MTITQWHTEVCILGVTTFASWIITNKFIFSRCDSLHAMTRFKKNVTFAHNAKPVVIMMVTRDRKHVLYSSDYDHSDELSSLMCKENHFLPFRTMCIYCIATSLLFEAGVCHIWCMYINIKKCTFVYGFVHPGEFQLSMFNEASGCEPCYHDWVQMSWVMFVLTHVHNPILCVHSPSQWM